MLQIGDEQAIDRPASPVVVVVDDDPAVRGSLKFALELEGFDVRIFATADEILHEDMTGLPTRGCLVIDYNLPGLNGLELLRELKKRHMQWPAILITSHPTELVRRRANKAGIAIIEKPLFSNALSDAVRDTFLRPAQ
ncbi:response regulator [Azorhizobium oxalatiphilum]|uniref:Response regulator n=1 Tax=Azorhizobium oxalatiphilum TaxID=980631 RepID=A0A917FH31_9HYPH|nr:response regulator [Azorhizobium oxalatiphilum]GGF79603.1 response regulator [Azorhizobium oxalatiphilum]